MNDEVTAEPAGDAPKGYMSRGFRDKFRFWIEVIGIPFTLMTLIFLGVQISAQQREAATRAILDVEDSERFINQMAFDDPEFGLLLMEAEHVGLINNLFFQCDMTLDDIQNERLNDARFDQAIKDRGGTPSALLEDMRVQCQRQRIDHQSFAVFRSLTNRIVHLLPLQDTLDFYAIMDKSEQMTSQERYVLLRSVVEKLNSRATVVAYIFIQEFEKMFRLCQERVLDRAFWRGDNAYEEMMHARLNLPTIKKVVENPAAAIGFHPSFIKYAQLLARHADYTQIPKEELAQFCEFKRGSLLIPGIF